jgi:succinyl-CoA synthetase alpha subunit
MAILVNADSKVLVQGITGREGEFHTRQMLEYGTKVVAGVTPGKGGQEVAGVPVFDTVKQAVRETARMSPVSSCLRRSPLTPSWRLPTRASNSSCASRRASPCKTWCV